MADRSESNSVSRANERNILDRTFFPTHPCRLYLDDDDRITLPSA